MDSESAVNIDILKYLPLEARAWRVNRGQGDHWDCVDRASLRILEEGIHCDVTLVAEGRSVKAHKSRLAAVSPVFYAMFDHHMQENLTSVVKIDDMSIDGLKLFLLMLYTAPMYDTLEPGVESLAKVCSDAIDDHFVEFWRASHKYLVVARVEYVLLRALERNLSPDNCWDCLNCPLVVGSASSACQECILHHFDSVIESDSFLRRCSRIPSKSEATSDC